MELKIKRETTFKQALDEVIRYAESLKSSSVEVADRKLRADDSVTLEIEFEEKDGELELEFEIKFASVADDGEGSQEKIIPQEEVWEANKGDQATAPHSEQPAEGQREVEGVPNA